MASFAMYVLYMAPMVVWLFAVAVLVLALPDPTLQTPGWPLTYNKQIGMLIAGTSAGPAGGLIGRLTGGHDGFGIGFPIGVGVGFSIIGLIAMVAHRSR